MCDSYLFSFFDFVMRCLCVLVTLTFGAGLYAAGVAMGRNSRY